jgi:uncharacterized membrane protein HdeD (DUF308 family)
MIKDVFKILGVAVLFLLFVALFLAVFFGIPALVQWCINSIAQNAHSDFRMDYWLTFGCWIVLGLIGGMFRNSNKSSST